MGIILREIMAVAPGIPSHVTQYTALLNLDHLIVYSVYRHFSSPFVGGFIKGH